MKRFLLIFLALCLALSLAGCGSSVSDAVSAAVDAAETQPGTETETEAETETTAGTGQVIEADSTGYAHGYLGDTMRSVFFDFTVNSAYVADSYEDYIPSEGNVVLVADVTVYNYTNGSVTMYDTDFQLQWDTGSGDDDYVYPVTYARALYPNTGVEATGDMLPDEYRLGIHEGRSGLLVFEVPAATDYCIGYQEFFSSGESGDVYWVYFTPENRSTVEVSPYVSSDAETEGVITAENGYAYGAIGDTMRSVFFDFTVNGAYVADSYEGYVPSEGNTLLVVDMTVYNYTNYTLVMYDVDFQAQWGGAGDEDYAYPVTYARALCPNTGVEATGDMLPAEYTVPVGESAAGVLVFEVPAAADYSVGYQELFSSGEIGDTYWVEFTPDGQLV
ncbi:MAG: DUF4352 domain-containing protein [Oscillospiraceae bacterium]|nr:DUF4352 domain-containing protein [Oscillospiraceae bacterium]